MHNTAENEEYLSDDSAHKKNPLESGASPLRGAYFFANPYRDVPEE